MMMVEKRKGSNDPSREERSVAGEIDGALSGALQPDAVQRDEVVEPGRGLDEGDLLVALDGREDALVELGVLAHPRVAVVDERVAEVLGGDRRQDHEPLLKELRAESKKINLCSF